MIKCATIKVGDKMNTFLIIIFIIIVVLLTFGLIYIYYHNKFNETIIRINEAENRIDTNLRDKYDILSKCVTIIKDKIDLDDKAFNDLLMLKTKKLSNFDLDRLLVKAYNDLLSIYDNNKKLHDNEELNKAIKQIELIDEELVTLRIYYNANISNYNNMVKKIPSMLVAKINKYKERMFYDLKNMNDNDYEDFKL